VKEANGKVLVENDQVKEEWQNYIEKLLNEENTWDNATTCEKVEGPCELIRRDEISRDSSTNQAQCRATALIEP